MKKKYTVLGAVAIITAAAVTGCFLLFPNQEIKAANLMSGIKQETKVEGVLEDKDFIKSAAQFAINLFQKEKQENQSIMVSPVSVYTALSMTANGAAGDTLAEMQDILYNGKDMDTVNTDMAKLLNGLKDYDGVKFNLANSIWFRDNQEELTVKDVFLQDNADYYKATAYAAPFDKSTVTDINAWCKEQTDGMIPSIVDNIDSDNMMYLINAISFDGKWAEKYEEENIEEDTFYGTDGLNTVSFMSSTEHSYVKDDTATGFIKPYKEGYSFVALLPNEGVELSDYINSLSGEKFLDLIENAEDATVDTKLPKFEMECSMQLKETLQSMGVEKAFDSSAADFSNMAASTNGNIYIDNVIHKTYISVDANGTKAAAATVVGMNTLSAMDTNEKNVILNRPFIYAIIDQRTNLPVFIGAVESIGE